MLEETYVNIMDILIPNISMNYNRSESITSSSPIARVIIVCFGPRFHGGEL